MNLPPPVFEIRRADCDGRINALRQNLEVSLSAIPDSAKHPTLCIYATGSLARGEASADSDLDAFFMLSGKASQMPNGRIRDVKILSAVVDAADAANFPDFSNDGEFLNFLHIGDVVHHIGSREDDYMNALTARMLLLLESKYLYNSGNFDSFKKQVIDVYFDEYHKHSEDFKPIFLLNDVLRFWRTLCLNYENARHWREGHDASKRAKGHLGNLKLKFSRLNICFSFICHLLSQGRALSQESALISSNLTPYERLIDLSGKYTELQGDISMMLDEYAWFLDALDKPKDRALEWISDEDIRNDAFRHAAKFVECTVRVTRAVAEKNGYLRYLIV